MKKIFLLPLFLILEGCLVLGAPHNDKYIMIKDGGENKNDSSAVMVGSFPKLKVVYYEIKKTQNSSKPDSVSVYFNEVGKLFSLDSIKENDDHIMYFKKIRMGDFKWYGRNYSDKIQVNVFRNNEKFEQEFVFDKK